MKDGTVILVIYDTILVIATSDQRAKAWGDRINRNSGLAQLVLKYEKFGCSVDFGGLTISSNDNGTTWSVIQSTVSSWKEWAVKEKSVCAETLWKAMGFLRFIAPIVDLMPGALGELTGVQSVEATSLRCRSDYRKVRPLLRDSIEKACQLITLINYHPRHWKSHLMNIGRAWKAASDATRTIEAFVIFESGPPHFKCLSVDEIQVREAGALADCIKKWFSMASLNDFLIVLCDNQPVLRSFARGWSACVEMKKIIDDVRSILSSRRIIFVDIDTDDNYADIFSRPDEFFTKEEITHRRNKSLERIDAAIQNFRSGRIQLLMRFDDVYSEPLELDDQILYRPTWTADEWEYENLDEPSLGSKRNRIDDRLDDEQLPPA